MAEESKKQISMLEVADRIEKVARTIWQPVLELVYGFSSHTIPWGTCLSFSVFLELVLYLHLDVPLMRGFHLGRVYPSHYGTYYTYYAFTVSLPFIVWAVIQTGIKKRFSRKITAAFQAAGLKNNLGNSPVVVSVWPIDSVSKKMRVTRAAIDLDKFRKLRGQIGGDLGVYIEEIKEDVEKRAVDIVYSPKALDLNYRLPDIQAIPKPYFIVGTTRASEIRVSLDEIPHLLVAGFTGSGKSTWLRQFIVSLYLNDTTQEFTLIDLKGGLESDLFEGVRHITTFSSVAESIPELRRIEEVLQKRKELLKLNHCKDINQFSKLSYIERKKLKGEQGQMKLNRHIIVVDEAAEMFLTSSGASSADIAVGKRVLSQVARQGRSLGVHLVIATQRPDSRSLDPQIKANLPGALCFRMMDDESSIRVLGNGRATDLPEIKGRAIWKGTNDMVEVQAPFLDSDEAIELLRVHRIAPSQVLSSPAKPEDAKPKVEEALKEDSGNA